jgi:hypothetical protein
VWGQQLLSRDSGIARSDGGIPGTWHEQLKLPTACRDGDGVRRCAGFVLVVVVGGEALCGRDHRRLRRWELLSGSGGITSTDGGVPVEGEAWLKLHSAAGDGCLPGCADLLLGSALDRAAVCREHHGRVWRGELLSGSVGDTRSDGGVPGEDVQFAISKYRQGSAAEKSSTSLQNCLLVYILGTIDFRKMKL